MRDTELGAYEILGGGSLREVTGTCAGCGGDVTPADAHVIRYHASKRGGIFHRTCEPKGDGWYDIDDDEHGC